MPNNEEIRKFLEIGDDEEIDVELEEYDDEEEPEPNLPAESPVDYGPLATVDPPALPVEYVESDDPLEDIELAKKNLHAIIQKANTALDNMVSLAEQTDNPRSYEVLATMLKTVSGLNKDFVALTKEKQKITGAGKQPDAPPPVQNITNNNVILSTRDFLRMLKDEGKDDSLEDIDDAEEIDGK